LNGGIVYQVLTMVMCGGAMYHAFTDKPQHAIVLLGFAVVMMLCDVADTLKRPPK